MKYQLKVFRKSLILKKHFFQKFQSAVFDISLECLILCQKLWSPNHKIVSYSRKKSRASSLIRTRDLTFLLKEIIILN